MAASIVDLLDWVIGKLPLYFDVLDNMILAPGVSVIAFSVAAALVAYFVGVLILRA